MLISDGEVPRLHLEVHVRERVLQMPELYMDEQVVLQSTFGLWQGATVLCACGALVHLDHGSVERRKAMGKPVECRSCRNLRVSVEMENLNNEFFDRQGD